MSFIRALFRIFAPYFERRKKDRTSLLEMIPKDSVCVEIGVWKGKFSKQILDKVKPEKLHLIDPWKFMPEYSSRKFIPVWSS